MGQENAVDAADSAERINSHNDKHESKPRITNWVLFFSPCHPLFLLPIANGSPDASEGRSWSEVQGQHHVESLSPAHLPIQGILLKPRSTAELSLGPSTTYTSILSQSFGQCSNDMSPPTVPATRITYPSPNAAGRGSTLHMGGYNHHDLIHPRLKGLPLGSVQGCPSQDGGSALDPSA
ncbi:hypothetical protein NM208_g11511 [Fusarium decemcellulare]|uniref:Uncharacterized protein n=1 Tax=Fusarium decemcellulare TaxID=57161 RepID=A0ACC1RTJ5_9HYPO|nr:hypothetical protein NM208_g11511 [Fusarium decemcellulare]